MFILDAAAVVIYMYMEQVAFGINVKIAESIHHGHPHLVIVSSCNRLILSWGFIILTGRYTLNKDFVVRRHKVRN